MIFKHFDEEIIQLTYYVSINYTENIKAKTQMLSDFWRQAEDVTNVFNGHT